MKVQEQQRYLTAGDVTRLLRIDKSTVYRMAEDGRLPGFKVGRQWRFRTHEVETVLGIAVDADAETRSRSLPIDLETARPLIDFFADLYGVMVVVTDLEGQPLTDVVNPSSYLEVLNSDPTVVSACAAEWRGYAEDYEFNPIFKEGHLGFECARAFVREGFELVAMVIAGGIAPAAADQDGQRLAAVASHYIVDGDELSAAADEMPRLDEHQRSEMLAALSLLARHLSPEPETTRSA